MESSVYQFRNSINSESEEASHKPQFLSSQKVSRSGPIEFLMLNHDLLWYFVVQIFDFWINEARKKTPKIELIIHKEKVFFCHSGMMFYQIYQKYFLFGSSF